MGGPPDVSAHVDGGQGNQRPGGDVLQIETHGDSSYPLIHIPTWYVANAPT